MPKEKTSQLEKEKKKDLLEKLKVEKKELANVRACLRSRCTDPTPHATPATPTPRALPAPPFPHSPQLRVVKASGGAPSKVMKIKQTRRNVARIMTALAIKSLKHYKKEIKDAPPKSIPKQLRAKKTRAIRRALPTTFTGKVRIGFCLCPPLPLRTPLMQPPPPSTRAPPPLPCSPTRAHPQSDDAAARKKFNRSIKTLKQFKRESNSKPAVFALKA
jgi:ribosomal protein L29